MVETGDDQASPVKDLQLLKVFDVRFFFGANKTSKNT